ncbi:MAG: type II toxin-antitoxin system RelE/ParE family toxin [Oscillospiraceae bacterium]|nr:type II toxin-antitoxin system RelE/ParE family toxin [Oscillospiraceae bacterium]
MDIIFTKQAVKQIEKLDKPTKQRIKNAISKIPLGDIKQLQGTNITLFRLRVGDFRIIFEMTIENIIIRCVLPRGEAYKNL